jgi:tyrosyl-tRNA synthetase
MMPILEGLDGVEKMSKSLNNYVGITEAPHEIYGKIMSISDNLMWRYYELLTDRSPSQIQELQEKTLTGDLHPMEAKATLAFQIVEDFHSHNAAKEAKDHFNQVFRQRENPDEMPEFHFDSQDSPVQVVEIMTTAGLASSRSEARRLVKQGGVSIDGERVSEPAATIAPSKSEGFILKVGKRKFAKILLS